MIRFLNDYFEYTRNEKTKKLSKFRILKNYDKGTEIILNDNVFLDQLAYKLFNDQDLWINIADNNVKTLLEWGLDLPYRRIKI